MDLVVGVDEVGRGSWAGPLLVVAAVAAGDLPPGLKDSKVLSKKQRNLLAAKIKIACKLGEGWVQPEEIDQYGLTKALKIGTSRALIALAVPPDALIIVDGNINYCPEDYTNVNCLVNADSKIPIVSAASIHAKVRRDLHMQRLAQLYPSYAFEKHVGYGTKLHALLLRVHGPSRLHRKSFKPVKELLSQA